MCSQCVYSQLVCSQYVCGFGQCVAATCFGGPAEGTATDSLWRCNLCGHAHLYHTQRSDTAATRIIKTCTLSLTMQQMPPKATNATNGLTSVDVIEVPSTFSAVELLFGNEQRCRSCQTRQHEARECHLQQRHVSGYVFSACRIAACKRTSRNSINICYKYICA